MPLSPIRILTRGSALALAQANMILAQCRAAFPDLTFELVTVKTTGDKLQTASLASSELPKGLFTKELEVALLQGEGDLAVHSLKDLPTDLPAGLHLGAVTQRADVRDVVVYRGPTLAAATSAGPNGALARTYGPGLTLHELPQGATVATSSTRRSAQLLDLRPDLKVVPIRGNVGTRLRKVATQPDLDATLLAAAGLQRLHYRTGESHELHAEEVPPGLLAVPLSLEEMIPAVGQAAIGIETRQHDPRLERVCAGLHDFTTGQCVAAERKFLEAMGGGCHLAVAAYAEVVGGQLHMRVVSFLSGQARRAAGTGHLRDPLQLGEKLAKEVAV